MTWQALSAWPYLRERPDQEACTSMLAVESGGESTQAGVIITADQGSSWKPFGEIVDATGRARMLEPTVSGAG